MIHPLTFRLNKRRRYAARYEYHPCFPMSVAHIQRAMQTRVIIHDYF